MLRRDRIMTIAALSTATGPAQQKARVLWVACGAHALHDGFTDTLYVLLPLWQAQFALSYAAIGVLRALYAGIMAGLQVPTAGLAQRIGGARLLAIGTAIAASDVVARIGCGCRPGLDRCRVEPRKQPGTPRCHSNTTPSIVIISRNRAIGSPMGRNMTRPCDGEVV
jgi:hypothetical protein